MCIGGSLHVSHEFGLFSSNGITKKFKDLEIRSRCHIISSFLSSRTSRQSAWAPHVSNMSCEQIQCSSSRHKSFSFRAFAAPGHTSGITLLQIAGSNLSRSYTALNEIPVTVQLVKAIGIIAFALWGLEPLMRHSRNLLLHQSDNNWKNSRGYGIFISYLRPVLIWTGVTLICRALEPVPLLSETSQAVKQRVLNFIRSLSTVLAFAYCLSRLIQQVQKFFLESKDTPDTRNMGFQFAGKAVYSAVWVAALSLFMELLGFSTKKWITAGGLGTVLLTLAGREILTNFLSSIMIHATRPFVLNEWIQTKIEGYDVSGNVEDAFLLQLNELSKADKEALNFIIKASMVIEEIFFKQVWYGNLVLRDWLKEHSTASEFDKLKWMYFSINKSPWSCLDENKAFLSTADSAIKLFDKATKKVPGWKGIEYRVAFPLMKPPGANFYPPDMDKLEFELWRASLTETEQKDATGFFSVIKRHDESNLDSAVFMKTSDAVKDPMIDRTSNSCDLFVVPYSCEYREFLVEAAELLKKAAESTDCSSLKKLLEIKAKDFLTNDYYESDVAWMELDSKLDVTIGPYETYEDAIFGYKATFEAFIGIRDDIATSQVKLFGDHLQTLQENLPLDNIYKAGDVVAAPIRVINLIYNAGDVKGPQTVAFNLPNDERIVNERGTSMVMLKNISESKFKHILQPIANICISEEQKKYIDFESFFTHTICHECCHGIGPHTICLPSGQKSTVRLELQELHSALEEAKADIVGLWALRFLINQELLPRYLLRSMYVSFLAGCFRSVRFGLEEAHGKGQALQFNWLYDKQAFILHPDGTFSVDFKQVEAAVEDLSREILIIQATGDKAAARSLLQGYAKMTQPLSSALEKLEKVQVPVDISPIFGVMDHIMDES